ncbi:MAG: serine hydrolase [Verrucomicrobiae bacterium]|nr:serine hydrolase [Verrucomicrobiae bacterium]
MNTDDWFHMLEEEIALGLRETSTPSLSVAVSREGGILWEKGFGWADKENRIASTEHTVYSLASVSKPFTATAIMLLREKGLIDLDRPVAGYLDEVDLKVRIGNPRKATIRRIANHTAGFPLFYQFFYEDEPDRPLPARETMDRYGNIVFPPGEKHFYSNVGYKLLDHLIAKLSKKNFADFMRVNIFNPLGMTHSSVDIGLGLEQYAAKRYSTTGSLLPFYVSAHPGASDVFSSAHDLMSFANLHLKCPGNGRKPILGNASLDDMHADASCAGFGGKDEKYGFGWKVKNREDGYKMVWHDGGMGGVTAFLALIPAKKIAVAALANTWYSSLPSAVGGKIIDDLIRGGTAAKKIREVKKTVEKRIPQSTLPLWGKWSGEVCTYKKNIPLWFDFRKSGDIHVRFGEDLVTLLNEIKYSNGALEGVISGDIGLDELACRGPYQLHFYLRLRKKRFTGFVAARSLIGERFGSALSFWVELRRNNKDW